MAASASGFSFRRDVPETADIAAHRVHGRQQVGLQPDVVQLAEEIGVPAKLGLVHARELALVEEGDGDVADRAGGVLDGRRHRTVARDMGGVDDVEIMEPRIEDREDRLIDGGELSPQTLRRGVGAIGQYWRAPGERCRQSDPAFPQQDSGRHRSSVDFNLGFLQRLAEGEEGQRLAVHEEEGIARPREGITFRGLDRLGAGRGHGQQGSGCIPRCATAARPCGLDGGRRVPMNARNPPRCPWPIDRCATSSPAWKARAA